MREIIFDLETTGFSQSQDRIVEIGAIEVIDLQKTGRIFHQYINPNRSIPQKVSQIHGIDHHKIKDKPYFQEIAKDWLDFIGDDSILVAHHATFDMKFLNAELERSGYPTIAPQRFKDTLKMARELIDGKRHNLDSLCQHFGIPDTRQHHGALLDSELLLQVYIKLSEAKP